MSQEKCRLSKAERKILHPTRAVAEVSKVDQSTASSRSKRVSATRKADAVTRWWERPGFAKSFVICENDPPCESCKQHNEHQLELLRARRKFPRFKHVLTDFAHRYAKLKVPWDELQEARKTLPKHRGQVQVFHGIQASDVTAHLKSPPARRGSTDPESPTEWFGLKSCDVTRSRDLASKCHRPPSRDYHHGIQATDVTVHTRIIPPSAPPTDDDQPRAFFGKPKTDVTNFDVLPKIVRDDTCRNDVLHPLGKSRIQIPYRYHSPQDQPNEDEKF